VAVIVADLRALDLDHLRALVGEHQRREPAGDERREVQHRDTVEQPGRRLAVGHSPPSFSPILTLCVGATARTA
jgi:hypothetical protein